MPNKRLSLTVDPSPIIDILLMPYATNALSAAIIELDLFSKLFNAPSTFYEIRQMTDLQERPLRILLNAFLIFNLLKKEEDRYHLTMLSETFLVKGNPFYLGESVLGLLKNPITYENFIASVQTGKPTIYDTNDIFEVHKGDDDKALMFTKAMHIKSLMTGSSIVKQFDFSNCNQIVDIGGGSGGISLSIAEYFPKIHAAVFDLPQICNIADKYILESGLADRVTTIPGDMFQDDFSEKFPGNTDIVLFSRILHDWPKGRCDLLLNKAWDVLPSKGIVIVIEALLCENQPQRITPYLENLSMLLWTQGEQFSEKEIENLLSNAGFIDVRIFPILANYNIITACKP
ncbi:MAG: hypothetical protein KJ737_23355 [Proteobacteria bacterium]|nr:hypothetical protein [Pseudomonadota bacterium]